MADVQKINKELEKLQLSDEESVFEEALVCPDARYRCHRKGSLQDVDIAGFGSLSHSANFLAPRGSRNDELLGDLTRTPPSSSSAFLKTSNESSYLSILPKVMLGGKITTRASVHAMLSEGHARLLTGIFLTLEYSFHGRVT